MKPYLTMFVFCFFCFSCSKSNQQDTPINASKINASIAQREIDSILRKYGMENKIQMRVADFPNRNRQDTLRTRISLAQFEKSVRKMAEMQKMQKEKYERDRPYLSVFENKIKTAKNSQEFDKIYAEYSKKYPEYFMSPEQIKNHRQDFVKKMREKYEVKKVD